MNNKGFITIILLGILAGFLMTAPAITVDLMMQRKARAKNAMIQQKTKKCHLTELEIKQRIDAYRHTLYKDPFCLAHPDDWYCKRIKKRLQKLEAFKPLMGKGERT